MHDLSFPHALEPLILRSLKIAMIIASGSGLMNEHHVMSAPVSSQTVRQAGTLQPCELLC